MSRLPVRTHRFRYPFSLVGKLMPSSAAFWSAPMTPPFVDAPPRALLPRPSGQSIGGRRPRGAGGPAIKATSLRFLEDQNDVGLAGEVRPGVGVFGAVDDQIQLAL